MSIGIWHLILIVIIIFVGFKLFKPFLLHTQDHKKHFKDEAVFVAAKASDNAVRLLVREITDSSEIDIDNPTIQLNFALYLIGICDYVSQTAKLDSAQWVSFANGVGSNYNHIIREEMLEEALRFYMEEGHINEPRYQFVFLGGDTAYQLISAKNPMALAEVESKFIRLSEDTGRI